MKIFFFIIYNDGKSNIWRSRNKVIRNLFRLKKEQNDTAIKDIRNSFRLKKEVKGIKNIVLRNINYLFFFEFEKEEDNYYKPVRINNFWSNNYVEYKSNGHKNRVLSVEENLDKIRPYLRNMINDLKQSDTWKIQLTISEDNYEEHVVHSESDNMKIVISDEPDEVINFFFNLHKFTVHER